MRLWRVLDAVFRKRRPDPKVAERQAESERLVRETSAVMNDIRRLEEDVRASRSSR
jgi:hypothetical protein